MSGEHAAAGSSHDPRVELDVVGAIEGADKSSAVKFGWDYLKHLEPLFAPFRDEAITVMEVGVQSGPSVRLWEWYFSRAAIVGIDIDPACKQLQRGRIAIEIGSQADRAFMARVCTAHPPTIFIDDGSHLAIHNIQTFEQVFPLVAPGGLYVVEDLAFHFGQDPARWQGAEVRDVAAYFLDLARHRLARRIVAGSERAPPSLFPMIDSVQFINSAVIIRKAYGGRDMLRASAVAQAYLATQQAVEHRMLGWALYLVRHGGDLAQAARLCEAALHLDGPKLETLLMLADIRLRQGDRSGAQSLMREVAVVADGGLPKGPAIRVAQAELACGLRDAAITRLEGLAAVHPDDRLIGRRLQEARQEAHLIPAAGEANR